MPYISKKNPEVPTLGVFVPCDPRLDEASRTRAFNIGRMTARLLASRLKLPDGHSPNIFYCSHLVDSEATADSGAKELKEAGATALFMVPDTWFSGKISYGSDCPFSRFYSSGLCWRQ